MSPPRKRDNPYAADLRGLDCARLPVERERELARRVAAGDVTARNELVQSCLPLVVHLVRRIIQSDLFDDAIQEGNLGLLRAAEKFDPVAFPHVRFSDYADHWIRQGIFRLLGNSSRMIRVPLSMQTKVSKLAACGGASELTCLSDDDLLRRMDARGINRKSLTWIRAAATSMSAVSLTLERLPQELLGRRMSRQMAMLDDALLHQDRLAWLTRSVKRLPAGLARVVRFRRLGVTFSEIGQRISVSRERARQLEALAIDRLREMAAELTPESGLLE